MPVNAVEESLADKFRMQRAPTLLAQKTSAVPIAFTRLRGDEALGGRTKSAPPEASYSFQVALGPMGGGDIWMDGKHTRLQGASAGDTLLFDLNANPLAHLIPPYDFMRFYLPVATSDQLAYERGARRPASLRATALPAQDHVLHGMALAVVGALEQPGPASTLFLDAIGSAFHAHAIHRYGGGLTARESAHAGLAPWQLRRASAFMEDRLEGDPSIAEIASECRLSSSHFARAFRQSTGLPPHRWLLNRRIERAKELLLAGEQTLAQIALACGFVDQSHLTRTFAQLVGHSPGKWRRMRAH